MRQTFPRLFMTMLLATTLLGCGGDEPDCEGAVIELSVEEVAFGDLALSGQRGVEGDFQVPERRTIFARNRCGAPLIIDAACLLNNTHNGDPSDPAFYLEYEPGVDLPISIRPGRDAALRVTFDVESVNQDLDNDETIDEDQSILVLFSNASNASPIAIPVCARAVDSDTLMPPGACTLPEDFDLSAVSKSACGG